MIYYGIASNYGYEVPTKRVIKSLGKDVNIIVFVSNRLNYENESITYEGALTYASRDNSFDYSPLYGIVETRILDDDDWVFLLHSTCEAGPDFLNRQIDPPENCDVCYVLQEGYTNIGLYSARYLYSVGDRIVEEMGDMNKTKAVNLEGCFVRDPSWGARVAYYPDTSLTILGTAKVYDGVDRVIEYYPGIDLYKYKANTQGREHDHEYVIIP